MSNKTDIYNILTALIKRGLHIVLRGPDGIFVSGPDASATEVNAIVNRHLDDILEVLREEAEAQLPSHLMGLDMDMIRRRAGRDWFELLADPGLLRAFAWSIIANNSGRLPMPARQAQAKYNAHLRGCKECLIPLGPSCKQGAELRSRYHLAVMAPRRTVSQAS